MSNEDTTCLLVIGVWVIGMLLILQGTIILGRRKGVSVKDTMEMIHKERDQFTMLFIGWPVLVAAAPLLGAMFLVDKIPWTKEYKTKDKT